MHVGNGFVVDRIQTGGVSNLNQPQEKIYELGNWETVATIRDIPDLSFEMESLDVSTEVEAILLGKDPTTTNDGDEFDFLHAMPIDIISPFKAAGLYNIVKGIVVPYLTLEQVTYRFGVRQNSTQAFTFRGDAVYYTPGSPRFQEFTITAGANQTYSFTNTATAYNESGDTIYALSACAKNPTTGQYKRLFFGSNYTNTSAGLTVIDDLATLGYTNLHVTYGTATVDSYPQSVHQDTSVKPAAVRGKDIDVYVGTDSATPTFTRWAGVQSFEVSRRVNLDNDEEFGNTHYVAQDYDSADVTGSIVLKPSDVTELWARIAEIANVTTSEIAGPLSSTPLPVELRINDPDTGDRLKTLYIPDARFTLPNLQGRVQTKQQATFSFSSDGGQLLVYQGAR